MDDKFYREQFFKTMDENFNRLKDAVEKQSTCITKLHTEIAGLKSEMGRIKGYAAGAAAVVSIIGWIITTTIKYFKG